MILVLRHREYVRSITYVYLPVLCCDLTQYVLSASGALEFNVIVWSRNVELETGFVAERGHTARLLAGREGRRSVFSLIQ